MFIYDYRIPEDDEEDVEADGTGTAGVAMKEEVEKLDYGLSDM